MKETNKVEMRKWPWTIWVIVVVGFVVLALPISETLKGALAAILYLIFLFYILSMCAKRSLHKGLFTGAF